VDTVAVCVRVEILMKRNTKQTIFLEAIAHLVITEKVVLHPVRVVLEVVYSMYLMTQSCWIEADITSWTTCRQGCLITTPDARAASRTTVCRQNYDQV